MNKPISLECVPREFAGNGNFIMFLTNLKYLGQFLRPSLGVMVIDISIEVKII
jgi:hypothetical protein